MSHLHDELASDSARVAVKTRFGTVNGGKASNGASVFLEIPYALPPQRFQDPTPLPVGFQYEDKDYISESTYCAQPRNDGQAAGIPFEDKVGFGSPSENPLFVNIVCPPSFPSERSYPVKIYIHGGFLQFGSPHGLSGQAQYISAERSEVWVNIGYRVSAFGFLACDNPEIGGNFGFKDQWLALEWIHDNILAFGGNPNDIQITGLSAGAHSVHQILHHVSHLPDGTMAPFNSAILQSNAIIIAPKTLQELRPQYEALVQVLSVSSEELSSPKKVPASLICNAIETDRIGTEYGTFRGCIEGSWLPSTPEVMDWQRSSNFARALLSKGVTSIALGDLSEEWYLYSIAHPIHSRKDIVPNLERYYPAEMVQRMMQMYDNTDGDAGRLFGEILADFQVYLPVRLLARDLRKAGFPVLRYAIRWTPEGTRRKGYVTHATDRPIWAFRIPNMTEEERAVAKTWLNQFFGEMDELKVGSTKRKEDEVFMLDIDKTIGWKHDGQWKSKMRLATVLLGEV